MKEKKTENLNKIMINVEKQETTTWEKDNVTIYRMLPCEFNNRIERIMSAISEHDRMVKVIQYQERREKRLKI